jgi:hypothetical protein
MHGKSINKLKNGEGYIKTFATKNGDILFFIATINGRKHGNDECGKIISRTLFEGVSGFSPCCRIPFSIEGGTELTELDVEFLSALYQGGVKSGDSPNDAKEKVLHFMLYTMKGDNVGLH